MTGIPYNYGKYIDDTVKLKDQGVVDAGKQVQSPASAGSRGLTKTTQFTKDKTQMQMGQTAISESMADIRTILNRIDGVNAPVQEKRDNSDIDIRKLLVDISSMKDRIAELAIDDDAKTSAFTALAQVEDDIAQEIQGKYPEAVQEKEFNPNDERDEAPREGDVVNHKDLGKVSVMKVTGSDQMGQPAEYIVQAKLSYDELMGDVELGKFESYEPFPEADEFNIEEDEDFEEVLGPLGFPEDETELFDAEYRGRKVPLNKPMRGDVKKFKVYVKDPKTGNVKKVNFGHGGTSAKRPTMRIRKSNPKARKSFRARHNCANPGPKTKARYWSCRKW